MVQHNTALSRECPVNVHAVELGEEGVEGRQGVLGELRGFVFRGELRQIRAEGRRPALGGFPLGALAQGCRQGGYVLHGQAQGRDLGELLAGHGAAGYRSGGHRLPQRLERAVDLAHPGALAGVRGLPAVLAERLGGSAGARLAAPRGPRAQLVLVVIGHRVPPRVSTHPYSVRRARSLRPLAPLSTVVHRSASAE